MNMYTEAPYQAFRGALDILTDDLRCLLLKSGSSPVFDPDDQTVQAILDRVENAEITVTNYARQVLGNKAVNRDPANNRSEWLAGKSVFTSLATGETVVAAVVYKHVGADTANIPISFHDLTDTPTNGGNIEVRYNNVDGQGAFGRINH